MQPVEDKGKEFLSILLLEAIELWGTATHCKLSKRSKVMWLMVRGGALDLL